MRKTIFVFTLSILLLALCFSVRAQQSGPILRIGFLDPSTASGMAILVDAFRHELNKLGWTEGKNIGIEYRFAEQDTKRFAELAAELIHLKVALIVATTGPSAMAAKRATDDIPIVMASSADPVAEGLVASLARPGGNVTGFTAQAAELNTKRLEILKDAVPNLSRVGLLSLSGVVGTAQEIQVKQIRSAAAALELRLEEIETHVDANGLMSAFQTAKQRQVNGIMMTAVRSFFAARSRIVELAGKFRLPAIYFQKEFVTGGGLMFYGADIIEQYRNTARYVDKILRGTKPADLPVQQPTKFEFIINLKAAQQIGLTIPPNVLARADKVIR